LFLCLVLQVTYENAISKSPDEEIDLFQLHHLLSRDPF